MTSRLVLGWDLPIEPLVSYAESVPGELTLLTQRPERFESVEQTALTVHELDPRDVSAIATVDSAAVTLVAASEIQTALDIVKTVRQEFPETILLVIGHTSPIEESAPQIIELADDVIEPWDHIGSQLTSLTASPIAIRAYRVREVLRSFSGELAVYMHDNPDPDAIASAIAVKTLAESLGVPANAYYYGDITHQSNRAFINLLDLDFTHLDPDQPPPESAGIALVDHSLPDVNNSLPADTPIDLIFDHHTPSGPMKAKFIDLRESVGATSSILVEYLNQFDVPIDRTLATALLFGIQTDTRNLTRAVTPVDFASVKSVLPLADQELLQRIESPSISTETMNTLAQSIRSRTVRGSVAVANVGEITERDSLAQAAELLLQIENIDVTLVYGITDDVIHASARVRMPGKSIDLSLAMRDAFGQIGSAGGHEEMAGASIPLGVLAFTETEQEIDTDEEVRLLIERQFFDAISTQLDDDPSNGECF